MRTPERKNLDEELAGGEPEDRLPEQREERLPMVAVAGRPNVGKSTLFNRIVGQRRALIHDRPGMTRDRRIDRADWGGASFLCVDTGGFDTGLEDPLLENVAGQARLAVEEADLIVFLTAVGEEEHPAEQELIDILRRSRKPLIIAVNKCDNEKLELQANHFYRYGFETIHPISSLHGHGVADLLDDVVEKLSSTQVRKHAYATGGIALAVVGRQNVGKSSLINRLLGKERLIASELPGTTRDAIDTAIKSPGGTIFTLIDTAGIRRRGKIEHGVERLSVLSSMIAIRRADVGVIVVDGAVGLTAQDAHIASYCLDRGLACMVVVNKWDLVEKDHRTADEFTKTLTREWAFLRYAPVIYVSALTGQRVTRMLDLAARIYQNAGRRIPTARLNERLAEWTARKPPPMRRNRRPNIKYIVQTRSHPPTFTLFVSNPKLFHFSYRRYLVNCIRREEDFEGTPVRLVLRGKGLKMRHREHALSTEPDHATQT